MIRFDAFEAETSGEINRGIRQVLAEKYADLLPPEKGAKILLKPNLNANMNALTGNTTDLRLIASVLEFLKERGYSDITIGEGTNSGYYRNRISVISRLKVDALARHFGVAVKDLNYSEPVWIEFEGGVRAGVARECLEADFFINMPKLKTHFEAGMSVCLKNLMGCLVGQENKKKTHGSLAPNILNINRALKPHLHIVDAVISMEGLGPTRGTPLKTGMVFVGTDPYLIDLVCAKLASFDPRKVRTLAEAERRGIISDEYHDFIRGFSFGRIYDFKPPKAGSLATFIHSPKRQKYFLAVRNTALFNYLCSTGPVGKMLYLTGLRQDVFIEEEMEFGGIELEREECNECGRCAGYCPVGLELPEAVSDGRCIECLYCFCVCPEGALKFKGKLGFMQEQLRQYDEIIKRIA
jgi:uncharacterized protein (DUF362 family)/NAD-dependent dihydropyrimidine dehydrogenase PreA subunit